MIGIRLPADQLPAKAVGERAITLPDLPEGLSYRSAAPTSEGLRLRVTGTTITTTSAGLGGRRQCGGTAR
jgi:hypothetical protein